MNFFTGFKPPIGSLFQVSASRDTGHSAVALVRLFWESNRALVVPPAGASDRAVMMLLSSMV
jgi:hypothetical protein